MNRDGFAVDETQPIQSRQRLVSRKARLFSPLQPAESQQPAAGTPSRGKNRVCEASQLAGQTLQGLGGDVCALALATDKEAVVDQRLDRFRDRKAAHSESLSEFRFALDPVARLHFDDPLAQAVRQTAIQRTAFGRVKREGSQGHRPG